MKANPSKNFKMQASCKICQYIFDVELNMNVRVENSLKFVESKSQALNWFTGKILENRTDEKIKIYYAVCPNCGCEEQIFYVPTGETQMSQQIHCY